MTGYAQYKKVPAAKLSVIISGLMILVGGLYIAFGVYADRRRQKCLKWKVAALLVARDPRNRG